MAISNPSLETLPTPTDWWRVYSSSKQTEQWHVTNNCQVTAQRPSVICCTARSLLALSKYIIITCKLLFPSEQVLNTPYSSDISGLPRLGWSYQVILWLTLVTNTKQRLTYPRLHGRHTPTGAVTWVHKPPWKAGLQNCFTQLNRQGHWAKTWVNQTLPINDLLGAAMIHTSAHTVCAAMIHTRARTVCH